MDTIEIIIYISAAVIIAGAILLVIARMANMDIYGGVKALTGDDEPKSFEQVTNETVSQLIFKTWETCGLGTFEYNTTFVYTSELEFSKSQIFEYISRMRLCNTLSSVQENCGTREDLVMLNNLEPGRVYTVTCDPGSGSGNIIIS